MPNKKISQLDAANASLTSIIPASDSSGTVTNKVTVQSILNAETRWSLLLPTAPTNVTGTPGNAQVALAWTASTTISQIPITDYVVQYSSNSGSTWTTFSDGTSTATSATVTGLTNGTAYTFRVAGVNGVGTGAYSTASSAVTPAGPVITITSQPTDQTASNGSATFSVSASVTLGATLSYQWQKQESGAGSFTNVSNATSSSLALSNLTNADDNGDVYRCVVSATGGAESVTSSSATLTVAAAAAFPNVTLTVSGAGTTAVNGTYNYSGLIPSDAPGFYRTVGTPYWTQQGNANSLYFFSGAYVIVPTSSFGDIPPRWLYYSDYYSVPVGGDPRGLTYSVGSAGSTPAPTVS